MSYVLQIFFLVPEVIFKLTYCISAGQKLSILIWSRSIHPFFVFLLSLSLSLSFFWYAMLGNLERTSSIRYCTNLDLYIIVIVLGFNFPQTFGEPRISFGCFIFLNGYSLIISLSFLHNESFPFHITLDVIFITLNSHTYEFISLFLWLFPLMLVYFYTIELFL